MVKLYISIFYFFFTVTSHAQENQIKFYNDWIVYHIEMVDGSKLIDRYLTDSTFVRYSISEEYLSIDFDPLHKLSETSLSYKLIDDCIKLSPTTAYVIEKIEQDTLVLREQIDGFRNDELKRLYFVSEHRVIDKQVRLIGQSKNLIANQYLTPTINSTLQYELNTKFNKHYNYKLSGKIVIYIKEQRIKTIIQNSSTSNFNKINRVADIINGSFDLWNLDKFSAYETVEIPFIFRDRNNDNSRGVDMKFFTTSFSPFNFNNEASMKKSDNSAWYYNFALEAYNQKKFTRAIKNFTKSYNYDTININALYNRAAIYYMIKDNKKACMDWKTLSELGQMKGSQLYENNCESTYVKGSRSHGG